MFELSQQFQFDAAHTLARAYGVEASKRIHGHSYSAEITLAAAQLAPGGMVVDLGALQAEVARVRALLDHRLLDDVAGLGAPTLENLCGFIWHQLKPRFPQLSCVSVGRPSGGNRCTFRPA